MISGERILVTGGAGFIGSHIVTALVERGAEVVVLDDLSSGRPENLAHLEGKPVRLVAGSVADREAREAALEGVSAILHMAAIPSVPRSVAQPLETHAVNLTGTLELLEAARRRGGIRRFVFAASSAAYGDDPTERKTEDLPPRPLSPYAVHKVACEHYMGIYARLHGLPTICLRYFNVFGPRQDPRSEYAAVIPKFITRMLAGQRPIIYGDGRQSRDFVPVRNVAEANVRALEAGPEAIGGIFNIGCGRSWSLLELVAALNAVQGTDLPPEHMPAAPGDILHSLADIARARQVLGYEPRLTFQEGLAETVAWYRGGPSGGSSC